MTWPAGTRLSPIDREHVCGSCGSPLDQSDLDRYTHEHVRLNAFMECHTCRNCCLDCGGPMSADDLANDADICRACIAAEVAA